MSTKENKSSFEGKDQVYVVLRYILESITQQRKFFKDSLCIKCVLNADDLRAYMNLAMSRCLHKDKGNRKYNGCDS